MSEKEPTIEYESNPEAKKGIPKDNEEKLKQEEKKKRKIPEEAKKEIKKKKKEEKEKEEAYKKEVDDLVEIAKKEGFSKAFKKAKKLDKKRNDSLIIDRFHDRLAQENLDD